MRRRISILLVLLCLLVSTVCIRPVAADEEPANEETTLETLPEQEEGSEITEDPAFEQEDITIEEQEQTDEPLSDTQEEPEVVLQEEVDEGEKDGSEEGLVLPDDKGEQEITDEGFDYKIPEGFVVKTKDVTAKKVLREKEVLDDLKDAKEGVDYKKDE